MTTYDTLQVDIGNAPNDDQGDPLRTAFDKINQRFAELRVFLNNRGDWAPNTAYTANPNRDWVIVGGVGYLATSNHTSGATFAADLAAGKWVEADALLAIAEVDELRADLASTAAGKGAALVAFKQAGAGAVDRESMDKMREAVSPEDFDSLQSAIDAMHLIGGGTVRCSPGKTYTLTVAPIVRDRVTLDLNGATLRLTLTGTGGYDYGVRVRSYACVINGTITVESSGTVGSQGGIHAPINIGPMYGDGGTVASPSADEGVTGWTLRNLKLSTNRLGKMAIQIIGGANNGVIENVEVPDSAVMYGAVHLDWGFVGPLSVGNIAAARAAFDAGTMYTTHPNNILIRNIKVGALSVAKGGQDVGSHIVRLSGVYNIRVENVKAKQCTYAGVRVTAGDVGFEFAPAAIKPLRMKGIVIDGVAIENTTDSWLVYADSYADNIASTAGYTPLIDPLHETDLEIRHVVGKGSGAGGVTAGLEVRQIRGGRFTDIDASGYQYGCLVEEKTFGAQIHGRFHGNRGHGIYIHHGTYKPEDVTVLPGTESLGNGTDGGFGNVGGVVIQGSVRCRVDGALLGNRSAANETTQTWGVRVADTSAVDVEIENCHVHSVKTGGVAYSMLTATDYGVLRLFRNNTAASTVVNKYGGVNIIPINRFMTSDGREVVHYTASRLPLSGDATPSGGTWAQGDTIFHSDPTGANTGSRCLTSGTPGTWGVF